MTRIRAYLGMSLDGRIAGPDDALDWLTEERTRRAEQPLPVGPTPWLSYEGFTADVGVMLMGRRTYDTVAAFDSWYYGDLPVLVATSRPLDPVQPTIRAISGELPSLVEEARRAAAGKDIYADGGRLVSELLADGLLDELVTSILPTVRGPGIGLFDALTGPHDLDCTGVATDPESGMVQLTWVPQR